MTSVDDDALDVTAAEYILGTDDTQTRTRLAMRVQQDASFAQLAYAWADRLQPLADSLRPAIVPENLWQRIQDDLNTSPNVLTFRPNTGNTLWRPAWIMGGLAAAASVALALLLVPGLVTPPPGVELAPALEMGSGVALAQVQAGSYRIEFSKDFSKFRVQTLEAALPQDRVHELWVVPEGGKPPRSLGVLARSGAKLTDVPADVIPFLKEGVTLAISLEPLGGAPGGTPTGPILMTGALQLIQG